MLLRRVRDRPPTVGREVEVARALARFDDRGRLRDERVAGVVERRACRGVWQGQHVGFNDGVVETVDHGVDADGEDVLVVLCTDTGSDSRGEGA